MQDMHSQLQAEEAAVLLLAQQGIIATYNPESGVILLPRPVQATQQIADIMTFLVEMMMQNSIALDSNSQTRENLIEILIQIFSAHQIQVSYDQASGTLIVPQGYDPVGREQIAQVLIFILFLLGCKEPVYADGAISFKDKYGDNYIKLE